MAIRIIVDSSADMEEDYAAEHDITIIPMTIAFGSEQFAEASIFRGRSSSSAS